MTPICTYLQPFPYSKRESHLAGVAFLLFTGLLLMPDHFRDVGKMVFGWKY